MKLDDALGRASAELARSTANVTSDSPPTSADRRPVLLATLGLVAVAGLIAGLVLRPDGGSSVVADAAGEITPAASDVDDGERPGDDTNGSNELHRYVSDTPPEGLSLQHGGPVADLRETGTEVRWIYGHADRGPGEGERAITIMSLGGNVRPPGLLDGERVDINGRQGSVLPDGNVMFELDPFMITVHGGPDADVLEVARAVEVSTDGLPVAPSALPGGYTLLGSFDEAYYEEVDGAVARDARVSTYRQGYVRYVDLVSTRRTAELDHLYRWLTPPNAETMTVDGRTFTFLYSHDDFGAPATYVVWFDEESIGEAITYGIDRRDVDAMLAAIRVDGDGPLVAAPPQPRAADGTDSDVAGPEDGPRRSVGDRVVPTVVLDGMEILNAVDHEELGEPDWRSDQYLYGPAGKAVPGPDDPVLLLTISPASGGLLLGEPIEIGGHRGVIVDKSAAGTNADIELLIGETTVQLTGRANVGLDEVIAAAEQYAGWVLGTGGVELGVPSLIGVDLSLGHKETIGVWLSADVNGPLAGSTVVYGPPGSTSPDGASRLSVTSTSPQHRKLDWLSWLYVGETSTVDLGEVTGVLAKPRDGVNVLRFELEGRVVEIIGSGVSEADVLAAADTFRADAGS